MALPESYTNNVGNISKFLEAIQTAGIPERVTFEFLKTLGFKSSNDRTIIGVLKTVGFLDQNGAPTELYKAFRDPHQGPKVLARALRTAYADLYLANTKAHDLPTDKLRGIIATKTSKSETVVNLIAGTFKALAKVADFSSSEDQPSQPSHRESDSTEDSDGERVMVPPRKEPPKSQGGQSTLHYNIQIHLPTTTDITVYNAIFRSLREHLF